MRRAWCDAILGDEYVYEFTIVVLNECSGVELSIFAVIVDNGWLCVPRARGYSFDDYMLFRSGRALVFLCLSIFFLFE